MLPVVKTTPIKGGRVDVGQALCDIKTVTQLTIYTYIRSPLNLDLVQAQIKCQRHKITSVTYVTIIIIILINNQQINDNNQSQNLSTLPYASM